MRAEGTFRLGAAALLLMLVQSCAPEERSFEELARAHAATNAPLEGAWTSVPHGTFAIAEGPSGDFQVLWFPASTGELSFSKPMSTRASREGGALVLRDPVAGIRRLFLCRFGDQVVLLPEHGARISGEREPLPLGMVFSYSPFIREEVLQHLDGYLPGPEDERPPMQLVPGDRGGPGQV